MRNQPEFNDNFVYKIKNSLEVCQPIVALISTYSDDIWH